MQVPRLGVGASRFWSQAGDPGFSPSLTSQNQPSKDRNFQLAESEPPWTLGCPPILSSSKELQMLATRVTASALSRGHPEWKNL